MIFNGRPVPKVANEKLVAKFFKAAFPDGSFNENSCSWRVFNSAGNEILVLNVKLLKDEIGMEYDDIATHEFGKALIKEIREGNANV